MAFTRPPEGTKVRHVRFVDAPSDYEDPNIGKVGTVVHDKRYSERINNEFLEVNFPEWKHDNGVDVSTGYGVLYIDDREFEVVE